MRTAGKNAMHASSNRQLWLGLLLAVLVTLSRLPFLNAGYGENVDAWRVARAARHLAQTGSYEVSRFPGYPVHEITSSFFRSFGAVGLNGLSAAFSIAAVLAIWLIARRLRCRPSFLVALAFAATPVFYVNSVTAKDYVWAIAFVLWAFYAALGGRSVLCGLLLGLAIGCRITSGAMFIPLAMVLCGASESKLPWKTLVKFAVCAGVTACVAFLPVWMHYGRGFFTFYENHERPDLMTIWLRGSVEVWGAFGLAGLLVLLLAAIFGRFISQPTEKPAPAANRMAIPALVTIVAIYLVAYFRLPDQAGYLIPIVPALLLLGSRFAPSPAVALECVCFLLAPWIDFSQAGFCAGAIIADHRARLQNLQSIERFAQATEKALPGRNTVVVGAWEPIIGELPVSAGTHNRYVYLLSAAEAEALTDRGEGIAYASDTVRAFNIRVAKLDLAKHGARNVRQILVGVP
ncbi:MAG: hypothetical protein ACR2NX_12300 [Chthoniobacterales bacterium]